MKFERIVCLTLLLLALWAESAFACEAGYCVRSTIPADGATDVPTDSQIFVFYDTTPGFGEPETSMTLLEGADQQGVLTSVDVLPGENPTAEVRNQVAVLQPIAGLLPNTEYEVSFPTGAVCGEATLRFTTGDGTASSPTFAGATGVAASCIEQPDEVTSCNDQEPYPRLSFELEAQPATDAAAYAVYRDDVLASVVPQLPAHSQLLIDEAQPEECFVVRAIGVDGAELPNATEVCTMTAGVCESPVAPDMGSGRDMGTADMGGGDVGPLTDAGTTSDAGAPDGDTGATPDVGEPDDPLNGDVAGEGCSCSSSQVEHIHGAWVFLLAVLFRGRFRR